MDSLLRRPTERLDRQCQYWPDPSRVGTTGEANAAVDPDRCSPVAKAHFESLEPIIPGSCLRSKGRAGFLWKSNGGVVDGRRCRSGRILRAATLLFAEHGYHGVSTREIANAVGLNIATVSRHTGSKAEGFRLAVEFLDHWPLETHQLQLAQVGHELDLSLPKGKVVAWRLIMLARVPLQAGETPHPFPVGQDRIHELGSPKIGAGQ
jgi:hypothetical protein